VSVRALALLLISLAAATPGCTVFAAQSPCDTDGDCAASERCSAERFCIAGPAKGGAKEKAGKERARRSEGEGEAKGAKVKAKER
jgi:hypothetical protein